MVTSVTTATKPLMASVADQSRGSDRLDAGHQQNELAQFWELESRLQPAISAEKPAEAGIPTPKITTGHLEPSSAKRRGLSWVGGWLFVVWIVVVCGSYLYYMMGTIFSKALQN
ncbi:MAG: hypothetical protein HY000_27460 [Planctomycetes bacterium]|nr:hypothetical protein [Planctomycetota bacterium]